MPLRTFPVQVQSVDHETDEIRSYVLSDPDDKPLPPFHAGAHIDVYLGNGLIRQYSLCSSDNDQSHYKIAVLRETPGTGGSAYFFDQVHVGDLLTISEPKNLFKLAANAKHHLLIAGGIGITPILSMVQTLEREQANYVVHYCTRTPGGTAFRQELENQVQQGQLNLHFDGGNPENGINLNAVLNSVSAGTHLYYCGPPGLMEAAKTGSAHWPEGTVHCEHFSADSLEASPDDLSTGSGEFRVRIARSGTTFTVPAHKSIVDVLRENGICVDTSCEEGFCGTCLTRYLEGEPEHRDQILDEEDHEQYVLICCARSKTPELVLDL